MQTQWLYWYKWGVWQSLQRVNTIICCFLYKKHFFTLFLIIWMLIRETNMQEDERQEGFHVKQSTNASKTFYKIKLENSKKAWYSFIKQSIWQNWNNCVRKWIFEDFFSPCKNLKLVLGMDNSILLLISVFAISCNSCCHWTFKCHCLLPWILEVLGSLMILQPILEKSLNVMSQYRDCWPREHFICCMVLDNCDEKHWLNS